MKTSAQPTTQTSSAPAATFKPAAAVTNEAEQEQAGAQGDFDRDKEQQNPDTGHSISTNGAGGDTGSGSSDGGTNGSSGSAGAGGGIGGGGSNGGDDAGTSRALNFGLGSYSLSGAGSAVQAKLRVSQQDDPHEREADQVAEAVVSGNGSSGSANSGTAPGMRSGFLPITPRPGSGQVLRHSATSAPGGAQANASGDIGGAQESRIRGLSGGSPLPEGERNFFESKMGHDFGGVRVHQGSEAREATQSINARAFTRSNDIAFAPGEYQPESISGRKLLAHELTHVVQQSSPGAASNAGEAVGRKAINRNTSGDVVQRMPDGGDTPDRADGDAQPAEDTAGDGDASSEPQGADKEQASPDQEPLIARLVDLMKSGGQGSPEVQKFLADLDPKIAQTVLEAASARVAESGGEESADTQADSVPGGKNTGGFDNLVPESSPTVNQTNTPALQASPGSKAKVQPSSSDSESEKTRNEDSKSTDPSTEVKQRKPADLPGNDAPDEVGNPNVPPAETPPAEINKDGPLEADEAKTKPSLLPGGGGDEDQKPQQGTERDEKSPPIKENKQRAPGPQDDPDTGPQPEPAKEKKRGPANRKKPTQVQPPQATGDFQSHLDGFASNVNRQKQVIEDALIAAQLKIERDGKLQKERVRQAITEKKKRSSLKTESQIGQRVKIDEQKAAELNQYAITQREVVQNCHSTRLAKLRKEHTDREKDIRFQADFQANEVRTEANEAEIRLRHSLISDVQAAMNYSAKTRAKYSNLSLGKPSTIRLMADRLATNTAEKLRTYNADAIEALQTDAEKSARRILERAEKHIESLEKSAAESEKALAKVQEKSLSKLDEAMTGALSSLRGVGRRISRFLSSKKDALQFTLNQLGEDYDSKTDRAIIKAKEALEASADDQLDELDDIADEVFENSEKFAGVPPEEIDKYFSKINAELSARGREAADQLLRAPGPVADDVKTGGDLAEKEAQKFTDRLDQIVNGTETQVGDGISEVSVSSKEGIKQVSDTACEKMDLVVGAFRERSKRITEKSGKDFQKEATESRGRIVGFEKEARGKQQQALTAMKIKIDSEAQNIANDNIFGVAFELIKNVLSIVRDFVAGLVFGILTIVLFAIVLLLLAVVAIVLAKALVAFLALTGIAALIVGLVIALGSLALLVYGLMALGEEVWQNLKLAFLSDSLSAYERGLLLGKTIAEIGLVLLAFFLRFKDILLPRIRAAGRGLGQLFRGAQRIGRNAGKSAIRQGRRFIQKFGRRGRKRHLRRQQREAERIARRTSKFTYDPATNTYMDITTGQVVPVGNLPWPANNGFESSSIRIVFPGKILDRFGRPGGNFLGEPGATISQRGMVPGVENGLYTRYIVRKPFVAKVGPASKVPDFGAIGGAKQYFTKRTIQELLDDKILRILP